MFGKQGEAAPGTGKHHGHSILQEGVLVRGDFEAKGDVRLDGRLEGKMLVSERLTIGPGGVVEADVEAGEVIVMGEFKGRIRAARRIELRKGARVLADLITASLVIEEGVHFHGNSNMDPESSSEVDRRGRFENLVAAAARPESQDSESLASVR